MELNYKFGKLFCLLLLQVFFKVSHAQTQLTEVFSTKTGHFANKFQFSKNGSYLVEAVGFAADVYQCRNNVFTFVQTLPGCSAQALSAGISDDGSYVAIAASDLKTCIYIREGESFTFLQKISRADAGYGADLVIRFIGNNKLIIVSSNGNISFYERRDKEFELIKKIENNAAPEFGVAALSPNGKLLATINANNELQCWQIIGYEATCGKTLLTSSKYVGRLDISDNYTLLSGCGDSLDLYNISKDLNNLNRVCAFPKNSYSSVAFNPTADIVITASTKRQLELYKIKNNSVLSQYLYENPDITKEFTACGFSSDGKWLAAASSGAKLFKIFSVAPMGNVNITKTKTAKQTSNSNKPTTGTVKTNNNNALAITPTVSVVPVNDSTVFVKSLNGYKVFKHGAMFGLKDDQDKIVFPGVLSMIDKGELQGSFEVSAGGRKIEKAYFGPGGFTGEAECDICDASGYVSTTFHLSGDRKTRVYNRYKGNGVWEKVTVITTTPPYDAKANTPCKRCSGLGKMRAGIQYTGQTVKVWFWKDELEKSYTK